MTDNQPKPQKNVTIKATVLTAIEERRLRFTDHPNSRMRERGILQKDIMDILLDGLREKSQDRYDGIYNRWKYAFRKDIEERRIRVIITEDDPGVVVNTAIEVGEDDERP